MLKDDIPSGSPWAQRLRIHIKLKFYNLLVMLNIVEKVNEMNISDWLNKKAKDNFDVSQIVLPDELSYEEVPDETIYFKEINHDGILSLANHPFSTVERFGDWYYCRGRDKASGPHLPGKKWRLFTKDKQLALQTAKSHIES